MPLPEESKIHGFQLWINLPATDKLQEPDYAQAEAAELPALELEAGRLRVLAGRLGDAVSPIDHPACEAAVLDLQLQPGGRFEWTPPAGHRALVRPYAGTVTVVAGADQLDGLESGRMAILHDAGPITLQAGDAPAGMLLLSGRPLGEPIVQYGPFVMNTADEIRQAILDYQTGALVAPRH
jgi:redox-sensitive bicupin YhaK (pirin superfamily)